MQILYSINSKDLALEIADFCKFSIKEILIQKFPSGEYLCKMTAQLDSSIVIVCSIKTNDDLMECLSIIDAAKRAGSSEITLVAPYIAYSRQNIMQPPFSSVGIEIIGQILSNAGIKKLVTVDMHSYESLEFFTIKTHHITVQEIINYYHTLLLENVDIIVAPDKGSKERINKLNMPSIFLAKQRVGKDLVMSLDFDVQNKRCLIVDDIFDSGSTMKAAYDILISNKAASAKGYITHFLGKNTNIPLYTTNSISSPHEQFIKKLSLAPLIGKAINS